MSRIKKCFFVFMGILCTGIGVAGVFLPVIPTTPLILAAAFFFSRSSERLSAWLEGTRVYKGYVAPFREHGTMPLGKKARMLGLSCGVLLISALLIRKPVMWVVLGVMAAVLVWLVGFHIPTTPKDVPAQEGTADQPEPTAE